MDTRDHEDSLDITKMYQISAVLHELNVFKKVSYPESIASTFESASEYSIQIPTTNHAQGQSNGMSEYTSSVLAHIQEWSATQLLSDNELLENAK